MKTIGLAWLSLMSVALSSSACTSKDNVTGFGDGGLNGTGGTSLSRGTSSTGSGGASGGASGGNAGGAGKAGGGGSGGARACEAAECLRAYECVRTCGGPVEQLGCCPCEAPLFDRVTGSCAPDGGIDAATGGTSGSGGAMMGAGGSKAGTGGKGGGGGKGGSGATGGSPGNGGGAGAGTAGVGGAGGEVAGLGGAGGNSAESRCQALRSSYADALASAQKCRLDTNRNCDKRAASVLGCSCSVYVDEDNELKRLADAYKQDGCKLACTAIACIEPGTSVCQSDAPGSATGLCKEAP